MDPKKRSRSSPKRRFRDIVITRRKRFVMTFLYVVIVAFLADYADLGKSIEILKGLGMLI